MLFNKGIATYYCGHGATHNIQRISPDGPRSRDDATLRTASPERCKIQLNSPDKNKLIPQRIDLQGLASFYNPKLDPTLPVSFFAAAFRFGHSLLPSVIERWSVSHKFIGKIIWSKILKFKTQFEIINLFFNKSCSAVEWVTVETIWHVYRWHLWPVFSRIHEPSVASCRFICIIRGCITLFLVF